MKRISWLRTANLMALAGLATVALAICCSVLLVLSFVAVGWVASLMVAITAAMFVGLWFVLPILSRRQAPEGRADPEHANA